MNSQDLDAQLKCEVGKTVKKPLISNYLVVLPGVLTVAFTALSQSSFSHLISNSSTWTVCGLAASFYALIYRMRSQNIKRISLSQEKALQFKFPTSTKKVKVVSYNIFLRPPTIKNNADDFKNERLEEFLKVMQQYDIIALQEIFNLGNVRPQKLIAHAKKVGFNFYTRSVSPFPLSRKNFLGAGLIIFSKYPIVERDYHIYNHGHQIDSWVAKQVIYAKVQLSEHQFVHVFTTHMQASYYDTTDDHNKLNDHCRLTQVDEISEFIHRKTHNSPYPALITGDYNVNAKHEAGDGESREYLYMMKRLNKDGETCSPAHLPVRDLLKEHNNGIHPTTYADVCPTDSMKPRETVLTHTADHCTQLAIDYIMLLDTKINNKTGGITVKDNSTRVEEFFVDEHPKITQMSDHYAVTTTLVVDPSKKM